MNGKVKQRSEEYFELKENTHYHAAVVGALAEKIGRFAATVAAKAPAERKLNSMTVEVMAMQAAVPRALMDLNNAVVAERDARLH
jgi:hypothetical protein